MLYVHIKKKNFRRPIYYRKNWRSQFGDAKLASKHQAQQISKKQQNSQKIKARQKSKKNFKIKKLHVFAKVSTGNFKKTYQIAHLRKISYPPTQAGFWRPKSTFRHF